MNPHLSTPLFVLPLAAAAPLEADWGAGASGSPGWERVKEAGWGAARHPMTWIPAALGVGVWASGRDEAWSVQLFEEAPLFGDLRGANHRSDEFRAAADYLWMASILATDSGEDGWVNKGRGALVQIGAVKSTILATNLVKGVTDREEPGNHERPEGDALLSQHATNPFAHAALIRENMKSSALPGPVKYTWVAAGYLTATGSAYGRIEAGGHHISDQLLGAAFGNFMATFINSAFMGDPSTRVNVTLAEDGTPMLNYSAWY